MDEHPILKVLVEFIGSTIGQWIHYMIVALFCMIVWNNFAPIFNLIPINYWMWVAIVYVYKHIVVVNVNIVNKRVKGVVNNDN